MTTRTVSTQQDCSRWGALPRRHVASKARQILVVIAAGMAVYVFGYFRVRHSHRTADGRMLIGTGSRSANRLFAPVIVLEKFARERPVPDQEKLLASVLAEAGSSHRPVLIALGTKGCLPCRQLQQFLRDQQAILAKYFVIMKADMDDPMTAGTLLRERYRIPRMTDGTIEHIPWIAFLDENGDVLVTAGDGPEGRIGIPQGSPQDRAWFLQMLRIANPAISDDELSRLDVAAAAFHKRIWRNVAPNNGQHE